MEEYDDSDAENGVPDDDNLKSIDDSNVEGHDNTFEEEDLGPDEDNPPLLVLLHSRALLAEGDEGLKVVPDILS